MSFPGKNMLLRKKFTLLALIFFLTTLLFHASGCSCLRTKEKVSLPAADLLKKGNREAKLKQYLNAQDTYEQLLEDFPDSKERVLALLYLADVLYKDEEYEEAKFNYEKFTELYPAHALVDRAHFYKAMCDFKVMEIASRDQTATHDALEGFEKVIRDFPTSRYYKPAIEKKKKCLTHLAGNNMEIAKYYFRSGSYHSAINRFKYVLDEYPDQNFIEEAIFLLAESYYLEESYELAKQYYRDLLTQYPSTQFRKDARKRLKKIR